MMMTMLIIIIILCARYMEWSGITPVAVDSIPCSGMISMG